MNKSAILLLLFLCVSFTLSAQSHVEELTKALSYRNIGPANSGGRVVDIEVASNDFTKVLVASASGGVWKSENAGTTWKPIFDHYETASIGDIVIDPNNASTIWVGTGEANNRNSVSWGNGIYKSTDGGQHFENMGLESTQQIARVLVNPDDSEDVCVCAIGHLWGYSGERGLFRTENGGKTWKKLKGGLPNDGKTGCTDIVRDSKDPNILYAAFYERLRQPWHFESGGKNGGIYKSTNNGKTWKKLTNGLPTGATGRIGLAVFEKNPKIIMAIIEAKKSDTIAIPGSGVYRSEDGGEHWKYVNTYNKRPFYYSQIRINPSDDQRVYVLTTAFMVSEDGGKTFYNGSKDQEIHGDFHAMWIDPNDKDRYYLGADKGFSLTHDHGKHFTLIDNLPITQFYRINYDYQKPYYIYGGMQDNGSYAVASFSRDARGVLNDSNWKMHWGDGQNAAVNPNDWTDMYSSAENGWFVKYNPETRAIYSIKPSIFNTLNSGDYYNDSIFDEHIRWNWSAPLKMSPHNPHHIFVGGNHVFKSVDQGHSWTIISPDLSSRDVKKMTRGKSGGITPDNTGAEDHASIYSLAISPISESVIWAGTDDGRVHVTKDGGITWYDCTPNIPGLGKENWVSRVEASHFQMGRAYISFDNHRSDEVAALVYVTSDFGRTWKKIVNGLVGESVRVIREDPVNAQLLFVGTETGVWCSIDGGNEWSRLRLNMPTVSVYDLQIHPRAHDLIVGTHGRGIWILDDISPLEQLTAEVEGKNIYLFEQKEAVLWMNKSRGGQRGHFWFAGDNPPTIKTTSSLPRAKFENLAAISFYVGATDIDSLQLEITDYGNQHYFRKMIAVHPGINRYYWDRSYHVQPYSKAEYEEVSALLTQFKAMSKSKSNRKAIEKFYRTDNPLEQRKIVENLAERLLSHPIPEPYHLPRAGAGIYQVRLKNGSETVTGGLRIVEDGVTGE